MKVVHINNRPVPLVYHPTGELYEIVFRSNAEFLGMDIMSPEDFEQVAVECIEFFTHYQYPRMLLVDIDYGDLGPRGCFYVAAGSYELVKLSEDPLEHFS